MQMIYSTSHLKIQGPSFYIILYIILHHFTSFFTSFYIIFYIILHHVLHHFTSFYIILHSKSDSYRCGGTERSTWRSCSSLPAARRFVKNESFLNTECTISKYKMQRFEPHLRGVFASSKLGQCGVVATYSGGYVCGT